jgi:hypothetical protein
MPVLAAVAPNQTPLVIGKLETDLLDGQPQDLRDVALVQLSPAGIELAWASRDRRGPKLRANPLSAPLSVGVELRAFLPFRADYVGVADATFLPGTFIVDGGCRSSFMLQGRMLRTSNAGNELGESGAPLVTDEGDRDIGSAAAVIIAQRGPFSLHEPIDRALGLLAEATGRSFRIF